MDLHAPDGGIGLLRLVSEGEASQYAITPLAALVAFQRCLSAPYSVSCSAVERLHQTSSNGQT